MRKRCDIWVSVVDKDMCFKVKVEDHSQGHDLSKVYVLTEFSLFISSIKSRHPTQGDRKWKFYHRKEPKEKLPILKLVTNVQ